MGALIDYEAFSSDLPAAGQLAFRSLEENAEVLRHRGIDVMVRQTGNGQYQSRLTVRTTDEACLLSQRMNVALTMHLRPPSGSVLFLFPRWVSGQYTASGVKLGNHDLLLLPEGSGADITVPGLAGSDCVIVPTTRCLEMTEALYPNLDRPEGMSVLEVDGTQLNTFRSLFRAQMAHLGFGNDAGRLALLQALVVGCLGDAADRGQSDGVRDRAARIRYARMARDFIEENFRDQVHMDTLCRATNLGVRTLQRCFLAHFGMSVSEYLKTVRLDSIYRALVAADPGTTTVARVGVENGYTHLGRLSVQFRERFGRSPGEVLAEQRTCRIPVDTMPGARHLKLKLVYNMT